MKNWGLYLFNCFTACLLGACSTTTITYDVDESSAREVITSISEKEIPQTPVLSAPPKAAAREPDIVSVRATVTDDYPEKVTPSLYVARSFVNVRDFPAMTGKIIGTLEPGQTVIGNEIEGTWIRIYDNSYTSLKSLKPINL